MQDIEKIPSLGASGTIRHRMEYERRPCELNGHQFHMKGWWHAFFQHDGKMMALVEDEAGNVSYREAYMLRFTDGKA